MPKFSRGHMTRREDPIWGMDMKEASLGNLDSMHVTNATPQVQMFNSPVWLGLENYALENSRQDKIKISVFTGPIFNNDDPIRDGVKIPLEFWKVIVFIHDETKKLCATGYLMSQAKFLSTEEFVFGPYMVNDDNFQLPIKTIEKRANLSFGMLSSYDPLNDSGEEGIYIKLRTLDQIKFKK
jgi:endonuclease G